MTNEIGMHHQYSLRRIGWSCGATALLVAFSWSTLPAGPPLVTDDPGTSPQGGWEVNISHILANSKDEVVMDSPRFDINYGLTDASQLKFEFPLRSADCADRGSHWGVGDLSLGWKHRFREEEEGFAASFYPQLLTPTGNECLGIGDGQTVFFCPFEIGRHLLDERLFLYGEAGYAVVLDDARSNTWKFGLAAEWKATEKLEALFEVGAFTCPMGVDPDEPFFNGGFRYHFHEHAALMVSAGRSFVDREKGTHDLMCYAGLQFTWGGKAIAEPDRSGILGDAERP
jgi:hypothetical protein